MADPYKYFRLEARELADELGKGTLALERGASAELVSRLLRHAHTLKGAARVVRVPTIADRAHTFEEILGPFRDGAEVPRDRIAALLVLVDEIAAQVKTLEAPAPPASRPTAPPPDAPSVRAELGDLEALLDGVIEVHARVRGVGAVSTRLERTRRLADLVISQLPQRGNAIRNAEKTYALAVELRAALSACEHDLDTGIDEIERELGQVREAAEHMRLVAIDSTFTTLERTVRDAAHVLGKQVTFEGRGGRVRIDAQVLAALQGALVQLVRNAVAHGIESPADRERIGKPAAGHVEIEVLRRGKRVLVRCRDDGRGLDLEAIRRAAQRRGLAVPPEAAAPELARLLLAGGISTATDVSEVAGRGIGLDVVREVIERLGGEVSVQSTQDRGTIFELGVPVSLAAVEVLLVEAGGMVAALPFDAVRGTWRIGAAEIARAGEHESVLYDDLAAPFAPLAELLRAGVPAERERTIGVLVEGADGVAAIGVDRLRGTSSIVVRPIPALVLADAVLAGASLDATGVPQLVLDPDQVVLAARGRIPAPVAAARRLPVLVVDDSLTTRMLEQSILESAGYDVDTATSAEEALEIVKRKRFALILVDVEMPGIDGFTFVERIRADAALRDIPAILVTSRGSAEDRARGVSAGAQGYMVKSEFDQAELLANIRRLVGAS